MYSIRKNIFWTGYIDWDLRNFHGYSTPSGSTYNAYLIVDEKPALIDTVKHYGFDEMLSRIKEIIDPAEIKYIISNHTEMDHSGAIDKLLHYCPDAEVVCSPKGEEGLRKHFGKDWKFRIVNTGDTLSLGKRTLKFHLMPMVHWPDSMATYAVDDALLFSNDAFGQHYASPERYVDEVGRDIILKEAAKYYANIVLPYGNQVLKVLEALSDVAITGICPSHGLIWREKEDIESIVSNYWKWAKYESDPRVVIVYDTMWHSTETMALKLFSLIDRENIPVSLMNLQTTELSDIVAEILCAKVVLVGSPMLNNTVLPTVGGFLTYLSGLKPKNRYGFTFGSYGWATIGFKKMEELLKESGVQLMDEGMYVQYIPEKKDLDALVRIVSKIKSVLS